MAQVNVWSKVAVAVQTVLATALAVSAITKASPAVATTATNTYAPGDIVLVIANGMTEMNNRVCRLSAASSTTATLEGIDSTLFGTFTSGTIQKITFGASAATFQDINGSGGDATAIDITTIHDDTTKEIPGVKSALTYSFTSLWDPSDAALIELKKADDVKGTRCVQLVFASGARIFFNCYPTCPLFPTGSAGAPVTSPVTFKLNGPFQAYAT